MNTLLNIGYFCPDTQTAIDAGMNGFAATLLAESYGDKRESYPAGGITFAAQDHSHRTVYVTISAEAPVKLEDMDWRADTIKTEQVAEILAAEQEGLVFEALKPNHRLRYISASEALLREHVFWPRAEHAALVCRAELYDAIKRECVALAEQLTQLRERLAETEHLLGGSGAQQDELEAHARDMASQCDELRRLNAGAPSPERIAAALAVVDKCLNGFPQAAYNEGKYLPPDVRQAVREYQAVVSKEEESNGAA